jgi:hypothetical protein
MSNLIKKGGLAADKTRRMGMHNLSKIMRVMGLLGCVSMATLPAYGDKGNGGSNGGDSVRINEASVRMLLEGDALKRALLNYLKTIDLRQINDGAVRNKLSEVIKNGQLEADIRSPENYDLRSRCIDKNGRRVPIAARIGDMGGKVCFDVKLLAEAYQSLNEENLMKQLAALTMHEHIHHLQDPRRGDAENETEADKVGAYVRLTATVAQEPTLKWELPSTDKSNVALLKDIADNYVLECYNEGTSIQADTKGRLSLTEWSSGTFEALTGTFRYTPGTGYEVVYSIKNGNAIFELKVDIRRTGDYVPFYRAKMRDQIIDLQSLKPKLIVEANVEAEVKKGIESMQFNAGTQDIHSPLFALRESNLSNEEFDKAVSKLIASSAVKENDWLDYKKACNFVKISESIYLPLELVLKRKLAGEPVSSFFKRLSVETLRKDIEMIKRLEARRAAEKTTLKTAPKESAGSETPQSAVEESK